MLRERQTVSLETAHYKPVCVQIGVKPHKRKFVAAACSALSSRRMTISAGSFFGVGQDVQLAHPEIIG